MEGLLYGREFTDSSGERIRAKNLPDGWYWSVYYDGSGSLNGPDGESFFEYDLASREMRYFDGTWGGCSKLSTELLDEREAEIAERYLPTVERIAALEDAGCYCAYKPGRYRFSNDYYTGEWTHVAISPDMVVDKATFDKWRLEAHRLENENFSDMTIDDRKLAERAAHAVEAGMKSFEYERSDFDVTAVVAADEILGKAMDDALDKGIWQLLADNLAGIIADISKAADPYGVADDYATDEEFIAYIKETAKDDPAAITNWLAKTFELNVFTPDKTKAVARLFPHPEMLLHSFIVDGAGIGHHEWHFDYRGTPDDKIRYGIEIIRHDETNDHIVKVRVDEGPSRCFNADLQNTFADAYKAAYKMVKNLGVEFAGVADSMYRNDVSKAMKISDVLEKSKNLKAPVAEQTQQQPGVLVEEHAIQNLSKGQVR